MTIEEVKKSKKQLESDIHELIRLFQIKTDLSVLDIEIETIRLTSAALAEEKKLINDVKIICEL